VTSISFHMFWPQLLPKQHGGHIKASSPLFELQNTSGILDGGSTSGRCISQLKMKNTIVSSGPPHISVQHSRIVQTILDSTKTFLHHNNLSSYFLFLCSAADYST